MGRSGVSGPESGDHRRRKRRAAGLALLERDGVWHVHGTVRAGGRSLRIRKSTGLPATPQNREAAERVAAETARELRDEIVFGTRPSLLVSVAADRFLARDRTRPLNGRDVAIVQAIDTAFGRRRLDTISDAEWTGFLARRSAGKSPQTRERILTGILAFLNWCRKKPRGWILSAPVFERDKAARNPKHRRARRVGELTPELVLLMIECAAPHLKGQLVVEWATGARVSSVLHGCRLCDLIAVPGRGQITFHDTKNGDPVVAALNDWAVARLLEYLDWRGRLKDREAPLFLTQARLPYQDHRGEWSGANKAAFRGMRRRAVTRRRAQGAAEALALWRLGRREGAWRAIASARAEASLLLEITQHWFRHLLATTMMAQSGDLRATMEQGGWRDADSVMAYTHDVPERRRRIVEALPIGTPSTRKPPPQTESA